MSMCFGWKISDVKGSDNTDLRYGGKKKKNIL